MLPTATDNGARLAAILPTGLAAVARGLGVDSTEILARALGEHRATPAMLALNLRDTMPAIRSLVLVVVDGLGTANLKSRAAHARTLTGLKTRRIETVIPSTTGAALTTLLTGRLPGTHGLIGYRIRHPELGLVRTLNDWQGISEPEAWQRSTPLMGFAHDIGARAVAIGRPAHATGGLTEAILRGAEYHGHQTIAERFAAVSAMLRQSEPLLAYLYVDELDRAAHVEGWQSEAWSRRLEQFDASLANLLQTLPGDVGVIVTADHGIVDVPAHRQVVLDAFPEVMRGVAAVGGEPRLRSLYLESSVDPEEVAARAAHALGKRAWVGTRDTAIAANWFGAIGPDVAARLGEVLVVPRGETAFVLSDDSAAALAMIGQHGGLSDEERGVPLALAGALAHTGFASAVAGVAGIIGGAVAPA